MLPHQAEARIKRILSMSPDSHNIFTPLELCDEVVSKIPSLDGNILVVANLEFLYTMIVKGVDENSLYFATPCEVKARAATAWVPRTNIIIYNNVITEEDINMKFDVVIGNPPYQESTTSSTSELQAGRQQGTRNLYDKFFIELFSKADNYVIIMPSFWIGRPSHKIRKQFIKDDNISDIINTTSYFPEVKNVPTLAIIRAAGYNSSVITVHDDAGSLVYEKADVLTINTNPLVKSILAKTTSINNLAKLHFQSNTYIRSNPTLTDIITPNPIVDIVGSSKIHEPVIKYSTNPLEQKHIDSVKVLVNWNGSHTSIGSIKQVNQPGVGVTGSVVAFPVDSTTKATNLVAYLKSKTIQFLAKTCKTSATNNKAFFSHIPSVDLTRSWSDAELYKHFNLTKNEIQLIEDTIK